MSTKRRDPLGDDDAKSGALPEGSQHVSADRQADGKVSDLTGPKDPRIAFVQSSWHDSIVERCRSSFAEEVAKFGIPVDRIDFLKVPGSFELPLHAKRLALTGRYSAVVAAGLVVDGGIYRHEFVAEAVLNGLMRVQLDVDVPVISAVLTPHHFHEHEQHMSFFASHFEVKGKEAAIACTNTIKSLAAIAERCG
jgi:6,7-dimethyl-8-ribityllumazine synthase